MSDEDVRGPFTPEYGLADNFPVGMRVLAVDDDPASLKVLENVLKKCDYEVTTTNEAAAALKMLREKRNNFDLLITDVVMPGMDGFKLLELLGHEMDLPVIMLSAYNDTKRVMKGVLNGACDYLSKPPRFEVLKNIWQHVVRKKKIGSKHQHESPKQQCADIRIPESEQYVNLKGEEPIDDQKDATEEDGQKNEKPTTHKRRRVVWTDELHTRFLAAVRQLRYEKVYPKRILELMNVEGLTRENVASHLQKHRIHLKKICQLNHMTVILGTKDSSCLQMSLTEGFSNLQMASGSERFSTSALSSYPTRGHSQTHEQVLFPTNPSVDLFQVIQSSLDPFDTDFHSSSFAPNKTRGEMMQHQASSSLNPQVASFCGTALLNQSRDHPNSSYIFQTLDGFNENYYS